MVSLVIRCAPTPTEATGTGQLPLAVFAINRALLAADARTGADGARAIVGDAAGAEAEAGRGPGRHSVSSGEAGAAAHQGDAADIGKLLLLWDGGTESWPAQVPTPTHPRSCGGCCVARR
jgi:hypothetical protein